MKLSRRTFLSLPLLLAARPSWPALSFLLPPGHFVPAKMPMHPVFPRPDSETQAFARHRWAHPDFRYEIPIGVQGGAWPFKYEIIAGPSGATIGQYYGDPDYGILKWNPAAGDSSTKTFTVRVTDQELNTVDLTWTTTIDAAQFIFVDANAVSTGTGTITSPLKTFADWYKGDRTDSTYHNKIIVFRAGNYSAYGEAGTNGNVRLDAGSKTPSLLGFPDETPVIDCSQAQFFTDDGLDDIFIAGIRFENARTDVGNPHFFWCVGAWQRGLWYNNYFFNMQMGLANDDNPAAIFATHVSTYREHVFIKSNTFDAFTANGSNGAYIDLYTVDYSLIEGNKAINSNTSYGLWLKGSHAYNTLRANDVSQNISGRAFCIGLGTEAGGIPHHHEVCWNNFVVNPNDEVGLVAMSNAYQGQHYSTWIYRNTFSGWRTQLRFQGVDPYHTDGNVVIGDGQGNWNTAIQNTTIPNLVHPGPASDVIDSSGKLIGSYRQQYLGIRGHEVSADYKTAPKSPSAINVS